MLAPLVFLLALALLGLYAARFNRAWHSADLPPTTGEAP